MTSTDLPAIPLESEVDDIFEGVIVDEPSSRPVVILKPVVNVVNVVQVVARHKHTRTAGKHLAYIPIGAIVVAKRVWEARSTSRYDRMIRAAEATGNHEAALNWEERRARFVRERHGRRMDVIALPGKVLVKAPRVAGGAVAVLGGTGLLLAIGTRHAGAFLVPFTTVAHVVAWAVFVGSVTWGPALFIAPFIALAVLWQVGRMHASTSGPAWLRTAADADLDISIDETTIAKALEALRIPQINAYLKQGLPLQYLVPCRVDGRGTHAVIRLPAGVTAERIGRRRADLATGLYRQAKEVWPSTGSEAGILDLWVADKGALAEGAGPYPLLDDGFVDVFRGVPFGKTLRGDPVIAPLMERNTLTGGMPGQGKSASARVIMCGAALDPTAELRILIPDTNFDFEVMKPRCSVYVMGAEDERIGQIRDELLRLREEVQVRGQLLVDHGVPAVTRELASADVGLHPLFVLLEEAHVAITHPEFGKEIAGLLVDIVKLGRKRGIHMLVSTQAPTRDSMPRDVTRNCSNGIAFAVGDHVANDALLGQGAYSAGHRATELIPGTDRGTALVKGFSGERSEMVQVYYLDVARGNDQVTPIIERSLAEIARLGREVPGTGTVLAIEVRDLLDDLSEVLSSDSEPVRLADLPPRLRKLAPTWGPYRALNGVQLRDLLDTEGIRVTNTGNVPRLDPADLRYALSYREAS
jgi:DNA segregation ATPase FtsK/SpoIIIE, S-DNA-T family